MAKSLSCYGEANCLLRPFCSQRYATLPPMLTSTTPTDVGAPLSIPPLLLELYLTREHEVYLGPITLLSIDVAETFGYFALTYHGLCTNARCWKWQNGQVLCDLVEVSKASVLEETFEPPHTQEAFLQWAVQQALADQTRNDLRYREKCVRGVYVESPELHPLRDQEED